MELHQKGLAGEYYVLAQLTARGYNASLTLGNTKGVDILVYNEQTKKGYKVEVKTTTNKLTKFKRFEEWHTDKVYYWIMSSKHENIIEDDLVYCFVHIENVGSLPKFFLVKSKDVAKYVREQHVFYQKIPREKPVKDGSLRQFRIDVNDPNGYENNWGILDN